VTRYILTIAGEGSRWGNHRGVRKHLVPINGEPNLLRTVRLIHKYDNTAEICLGINPLFPPPESLNHGTVIYDGTTYKAGAESDRYFASAYYWNRNGRTVLIWGDVFFTENGIKTICEPQKDWLRYGRPGRCIYSSRKTWGEEFAISFNPEHHSKMLLACNKVECISKDRETQLFGAIYLAMLGKTDDQILSDSLSGKKPNYGNMIEINDLTDDFDFPEDYEEFLQAYRGE
jgi:hypothetical protein